MPMLSCWVDMRRNFPVRICGNTLVLLGDLPVSLVPQVVVTEQPQAVESVSRSFKLVPEFVSQLLEVLIKGRRRKVVFLECLQGKVRQT